MLTELTTHSLNFSPGPGHGCHCELVMRPDQTARVVGLRLVILLKLDIIILSSM